ncbi:MAG: hypothetical protein U0Q15_14230 [Kineosporiaceae bacterium]
MGKLGRVRNAAGALAAQFSQAAGSLLIGIVAGHQLPLDGFATVQLVLGVVVVTTAISTGLVGDSLTVLNRSDPALRAALGVVLAVIVALVATLSALISLVTHVMSTGGSLAFGILIAVWLAEDTLRRLLMASGRFWSIVAVDSTHLLVSGTLVIGWRPVTGRDIEVPMVLLALAAGQVAATVVAIARLPRHERHLGHRPTRAAVSEVVRFGTQRAVQAALRPVVLLALRLIVVAAVGKTLYGQLELARLWAAPALLVVNGAGSFLLASFAKQREHRRSSLRKSDAAAVLLTVSSLAATGAALLGSHLFPTLMAKHPAEPVAILAWGLYTASVGLVMPYGSLGAVSGRQRNVLHVRLAETVASLGFLVLLVPTGIWGPQLSPVAIAFGSIVGAMLMRPVAARAVVRPSRHREDAESKDESPEPDRPRRPRTAPLSHRA